MRFTDGTWHTAPGLRIHEAKNIWESSRIPGGILLRVPCTIMHDLNDTTYGPIFSVEITAPRPEIFRIRAWHYDGGLEKGPYFALNTEPVNPEIQEDDKTITLINGAVSLVINKDGPFAYTCYENGKALVTSGGNTLAYITDIDYEADLWCDYNHRPLRSDFQHQNFMREQLSLRVGETVYGLGERFTSLIKNGQHVEIWNRDGSTAGDQSYKNIPFYLSSRGYGVLVNHPEFVDFQVATENVRKVQFAVEGEKLDYLVIGGGSPKAVLSNYTALTGRTPVPPSWSFGLWLSSSWTPSYDEPVIEGFIDKMKEHNIPLSVFHYDAAWMKPFELVNLTWDEKFGDPSVMLKKIKKNGARICVWINPYISQYSRLFNEGKEQGYLLKKKDGSVWQTDVWMPGMGIVDFTNPAACEWFAGHLAEVLDTGVDCIKTDFGERIPLDVAWYDGSDPKKMHNYYPYLYNKTVFNLLKEKKGARNAIVFSRSATVGTQQFPVNWGGDNIATYESMAESLRGGLSFCCSGYAYWAHDISGFDSTATPDLYKRWAAFGLLSTHSRLHGHDTYRVPWNFGEEACDVLGFFTRLKCSLMPYLFRKAVQVQQEGVPMMRPVFLEYPEDPTAWTLDREYLLGDKLLIAPVFSEDGEVTFYLPEGNWVNLLTGDREEGQKWLTRTYDYFSLPLFVRENSLLLTGNCDQKPDYEYGKGFTATWYSPKDGVAEEEIYEDSLEVSRIVRAEKTGNQITVSVTGAGEWNFRVYGCKASSKEASGIETDQGTLFKMAEDQNQLTITL